MINQLQKIITKVIRNLLFIVTVSYLIVICLEAVKSVGVHTRSLTHFSSQLSHTAVQTPSVTNPYSTPNLMLIYFYLDVTED